MGNDGEKTGGLSISATKDVKKSRRTRVPAEAQATEAKPAENKAAGSDVDISKVTLEQAIPDSLSSKEEILFTSQYVDGILKRVHEPEYIGNLKICDNCGEKNNASTKVCPFCGDKFPADTIVEEKESAEIDSLLTFSDTETLTASQKAAKDEEKKEEVGKKLSAIFKDDLADIDDDDDDDEPISTVEIPTDFEEEDRPLQQPEEKQVEVSADDLGGGATLEDENEEETFVEVKPGEDYPESEPEPQPEATKPELDPRIGDKKICPKCGTLVDAINVLCPNCGRSFEKKGFFKR